MTHHDSRATVINQEILPSPVAGGDIIHLIRRDRQHIEITITRMKAQERMLLGIPLDVNLMGVQEWDALPGIGPALARAIVSDRQINGEFGSVDDLVRVPGMGKKKLSAIRRFF
jgi:competence protein ComEA